MHCGLIHDRANNMLTLEIPTMRSIKFRAWDIDRKELFFPSSISWKDGVMWAANVHGENRYETVIEKSELMQFTGLLDKNGKEIYEGDIVRYSFLDVFLDVGKIIWTNSARFVWWARDEGNGYAMTFRDAENREIIGNIHENPELLTEVVK